MNQESVIKASTAILGGLIGALLGGFDTLIKVVFLLMFLDIVVGWSAAAFFNVSKYSKNGLTSDAMLKGAVRKGYELIIIMLGVSVDKVLGFNYVRNACVMYLICSEALSILENFVKVNVPFPKFIKDLLTKILEQEDNNGSMSSN